MASIEFDTVAPESTKARDSKSLHPCLYLLGGVAAMVCAATVVNFLFGLIA